MNILSLSRQSFNRNHALYIFMALFTGLMFCSASMAGIGPIWTQVGLDIDGEAASDQSGRSVSLSSDGTTVAIGANANDGNGSGAGHVRVYQYGGGTWSQLGQDIDGEAPDDQSGYSVSLSSDGTTVAIGSCRNDDNGSNAGHVRVYRYSGGIWTKLGSDIDGEAANDQSGYSVSLSSDGDTVAIGAFMNDGNGLDAGHVRVYQFGGGIWTQLGSDIDGEAGNDYSGASVSLSSDGDILAIGANFNNGNGSLAGHVRVYQYAGGIWNQLGQDIDGEAANDQSGYSVSLSSNGATVAIGAIGNAGNGAFSGHVRVYQFGGGTWSQLGQDIDGEVAGDQAGRSVSLSPDGTTVAVGAYYNDGNGSDAGHVRVYQYGGGIWSQLGLDIDGEAAGDYSGFSVSLSSDGTTVAIGASGNDGNGSTAGHVRVWEIPAPACDSSPSASTLTSPTGIVNQALPVYTWETTACADSYYLLIQNQFYKTIFRQQYSVATVDNGDDTCSINPLKVLAPGGYYWLVRGKNQHGTGPNSTKMAFTVATTQVPPASPTLNTPTGAIAETTPTFDWDTVANADLYYLIIQNSSQKSIYKKWYALADVDNGDGTCSINPGKTLPPGDYYWRVRAKNQYGTGPNSVKMAFTVSPLP